MNYSIKKRVKKNNQIKINKKNQLKKIIINN